MPTITVENYLKCIFKEQQQRPKERVPMGALSRSAEVSPGTATTMAKALERDGLVSYEKHVGVRLTEEGEQAALSVLRKHRLVEMFLVKTLGMDWSEVHVEAEQLEHAISDKVLARIDSMLGNPQFDPHGDPIPSADGVYTEEKLKSLKEMPIGAQGKVARVVNQEPAFLQYVQTLKMRPGAKVRKVLQDPIGQVFGIQIGGDEAVQRISSAAAEEILIERTEE